MTVSIGTFPLLLLFVLFEPSIFPTALALPAPQSFTFPGCASSAGNDESSGGAPIRGPPSLLGNVPDALSDSNSAIVPTTSYALVPGQTDAADIGVPFSFEDAANPQPIRGDPGATDPGPRTYAYDRLNPDLLAPPASDTGDLPNAKWPMGLSHNRILPGNAGWARQQNVGQLPIANAMAGVDLDLAPNAYREIHWHQVLWFSSTPVRGALSLNRPMNGATS